MKEKDLNSNKKENKTLSLDEIEARMTELAEEMNDDNMFFNQQKLQSFKEIADFKIKRIALEKENEQTIYVQTNPLKDLLGIKDKKEEKTDANSRNELN